MKEPMEEADVLPCEMMDHWGGCCCLENRSETNIAAIAIAITVKTRPFMTSAPYFAPIAIVTNRDHIDVMDTIIESIGAMVGRGDSEITHPAAKHIPVQKRARLGEIKSSFDCEP
jgi:hypothetical protein